ncbi:MAG TPA: DUF4286 family protein [Phycisphaerae bacterium]|nr:DUF4286 family protein [Phycisphaerae bacterium]
MARAYYEVSASISDATIAAAWVRWMRDAHIADVVAAGALSGRVISIDRADADGPNASHEFCVQYEFADRSALDRYLSDHAPRLRAEGLVRFGPEQIRYSRRSGEILG